MKSFVEVSAAKIAYLHVFNGQWPEWFRGVGIGFDTLTGIGYVLAIRVREEKDTASAMAVVQQIGYDGPVDIKAIGDIVAF